MFCLAAVGQAQPSFMDLFRKYYKIAPDSQLFKAECLVCHGPEGHAVKNFFGKQLMSRIDKSKDRILSEDILVEVEPIDADGDGYTDIEEILSGTFPGNPNSHPAAHDPKLPKTTRKPSFLPQAAAGGAGILLIGGALLMRAKARRIVNS